MRQSFVDLDDTELVRLLRWGTAGRPRWHRPCVCAAKVHHVVDVHHEDVVATEDHDLFGVSIFDEVEVLVDGIGGAAVPVLAGALLGRHRDDEVVRQDVAEVPGLVQVLVQALALEHGQHVDASRCPS